MASVSTSSETQASAYQEILDNINQGVVLLDRQRRFVACNDRYIELMQIDRRMFKPGSPAIDVSMAIAARGDYGDGDIEAVAKARLDHIYGLKDIHNELRTLQGRTFDLEIRPVKNGGIVLTYTDITDKLKVEGELAERSRLLASIMETIAQGVVMFDPDRRLVTWNREYEKALKFPKGYLKPGLTAWDIGYFMAGRGDYGEGDPTELTNERQEVFWGDGKSKRSELKVLGEREFDVLFQPTADGSLVFTYTDITERKQAEAEMARQRDELEVLNQRKIKLFSIIAHDLMGPFNALLGYTQLLTKPDVSLRPRQIVEFASLINRSAETYYRLLEDLLTWGKSQMEDLRFQPEATRIDRLIQAGIDTMSSTAKEKSVELSWEAPSAYATLDVNMVMMVIRNLVGNAIKFTDAGGQVEVKALNLGDYLEISVSDNGVGIEKRQLDAINRNEPGVSTPGTEGEQGSGLGLQMCHEFVKRHAGVLKADSKPGKGSVFRFTLPVNAETKPPEAE